MAGAPAELTHCGTDANHVGPGVVSETCHLVYRIARGAFSIYHINFVPASDSLYFCQFPAGLSFCLLFQSFQSFSVVVSGLLIC